jgi:hypothetical protein
MEVILLLGKATLVKVENVSSEQISINDLNHYRIFPLISMVLKEHEWKKVLQHWHQSFFDQNFDPQDDVGCCDVHCPISWKKLKNFLSELYCEIKAPIFPETIYPRDFIFIVDRLLSKLTFNLLILIIL